MAGWAIGSKSAFIHRCDRKAILMNQLKNAGHFKTELGKIFVNLTGDNEEANDQTGFNPANGRKSFQTPGS